MRFKISLEVEDKTFKRPNKHAVQGFIYNLLKDIEYGARHHQHASSSSRSRTSSGKSEKRMFYRFIKDAGLGEENSLGFGFLNP